MIILQQTRGFLSSNDGLSLDLPFATTKSLTARVGPTPTFTRASSATFVDSDGLIKSAAVNTPRFDHDPITGVCRGLLLEESRTNSLLRSGELATSPWSLNNTTASNVTAPDGSNTAIKLMETAQSTQFFTRQNITFATGTYTLSAYLKAAERTRSYMEIGNATINFNLTTGVASGGSQFGSGWTFLSARVTNAGNGWWRCELTASCTIAGTYSGCKLHIANDTGNIVYAGIAGNGILAWGAQVETGSFATSYIPTTTASVVRSADVCSITGTNFTSFYNQTEGTISVNYSRQITTATNKFNWVVAMFYNATATGHYNAINATPSSDASCLYRQISGSIYNVTSSLSTANTPVRIAYGFASANFAHAKNGSLVNTGANAITETANFDRVEFGFSNNGNLGSAAGQYLQGCISSVKYYRRRLPNAKLQALTV